MWDLSLGRVADLEPGTVAVALFSAYLAPDDIPLGRLRDFLRGFRSFGGTAADPVRWARSVGLLVKYGLIRRTGDTIAMHRLLQAAIRTMSKESHPNHNLLGVAALEMLRSNPVESREHMVTALSYTVFSGDQAAELYRIGLVVAVALYGPDDPVTERIRRLADG